MEKICRNCKYYMKMCDCNYYGTCNNTNMQYETAYSYEKSRELEEIEKDKLFYMDYEWYNAGIEVGEEFGCIHFEKKEKELKLENTDGYNYEFEEVGNE